MALQLLEKLPLPTCGMTGSKGEAAAGEPAAGACPSVTYKQLSSNTCGTEVNHPHILSLHAMRCLWTLTKLNDSDRTNAIRSCNVAHSSDTTITRRLHPGCGTTYLGCRNTPRQQLDQVPRLDHNEGVECLASGLDSH